MFTIIAAFIVTREFTEETSRILFTYPVSRYKIYISKIILTYIIIFFIYLLQFSFIFVTASFDETTEVMYNLFVIHGKAYLLSLVLQYILIPFIVFMALFFKNSIVPLKLKKLAVQYCF